MTKRIKLPDRKDALLAAAGVTVGLAIAAGYGAYRAASGDGGGATERMADFALGVLWPGSLIAVVVAVIVVLGWKMDLE